MIDDPPWFQVSEEDVGYQVHQRHREATAPDADLVTGEGQEAAHLHGEHDGFAAPQRHLGALVVHDWHQPDHLALHNSRSIIVEIVQACFGSSHRMTSLHYIIGSHHWIITFDYIVIGLYHY